VSGDIFFLQRHWASTGGAVAYVMGYLASQVRDRSTSARLTELAESNVCFLNLSDPEQAELVDIIVDVLPSQVAGLEHEGHREYLRKAFEDLYRCAREQQDYNKDPSQPSYFTIGPNAARYFDIGILRRVVSRQLTKVDYVRIDVSNHTAQQRATVSDYLAELADPRVFIVSDDL
jgi:hypothetical protein